MTPVPEPRVERRWLLVYNCVHAELGLGAANRLRGISYVHFDAYHPDMCHVSDLAGKLIKGPAPRPQKR